MPGYFCIRFNNFVLKDKSLLDFSRKKYEKIEQVILK